MSRPWGLKAEFSPLPAEYEVFWAVTVDGPKRSIMRRLLHRGRAKMNRVVLYNATRCILLMDPGGKHRVGLQNGDEREWYDCALIGDDDYLNPLPMRFP